MAKWTAEDERKYQLGKAFASGNSSSEWQKARDYVSKSGDLATDEFMDGHISFFNDSSERRRKSQDSEQSAMNAANTAKGDVNVQQGNTEDGSDFGISEEAADTEELLKGGKRQKAASKLLGFK